MADAGQRIDRWLWFARFLKTRTMAARLVSAGKVRVNGGRVTKPSHVLAVGDVLTFSLGSRVRVVKVAAAGGRRGPYAEACLLYEDLTEPDPPAPDADPEGGPPGGRPRGSGRPTKKERRSLDDWLDGST